MGRISIIGCYGDKNAGDEAILDATLQFLRRALPSVGSVCVFSNDPEETSKRYNVEAVLTLNTWKPSHWYGLFGKGKLSIMRKAIRGADLLLLGGGDALRDDVGMISYLGVSQKAVWAKRYGVPFALWDVGMGPMTTAPGRMLTRWLLRNAVFAYFRDAESAERARQLAGTTEPRAWFVFPDIALFLEDSEQTPRADARRVVFSLVDFESAPHRLRKGDIDWPEYVRGIQELIKQFVNRGYDVVFLPFDDRDVPFHAKLAGECRADKVQVYNRCLSPTESKRLLRQAQRVVGMRLHACVLAVAANTPVVALAYDEKVRRVMTSLGLGECVLQLQDGVAPVAFDRVAALHQRCADLLPSVHVRLRDDYRQMRERLGDALRTAVSRPEHATP